MGTRTKENIILQTVSHTKPKFATASDDFRYWFYIWHEDKKYGIRFNGVLRTTEPTHPDYMRTFKRIAKELSDTDEKTKEFHIVGVLEGTPEATHTGVNINTVFPGYLNLVLPLGINIQEMVKEELRGKIGIRINCTMTRVDN